MPNIPLKVWAERKKISRRKAEYLAGARPDLVVTELKTFKIRKWVKCVDASLNPDDFLLRN